MFSWGRAETKEEMKARVEMELEKDKERKRRIKEKRLANLRKAREISLLRKKLAKLDKLELVEMIVKSHKENEKLASDLHNEQSEVYEAERRGYRQAGEDHYNSLSQAEKDNIQWERDRASDRLVN